MASMIATTAPQAASKEATAVPGNRNAIVAQRRLVLHSAGAGEGVPRHPRAGV